MRVSNTNMSRMTSRSILLLTAVVLVAWAGLAGAASVTITSPSDNSSVPVGNVTISVHVNDFKLVPKYGQANVAGEGHLHYYIDVPVPKTHDEHTVHESSINTSYTWHNVKAGKHNFTVRLANNDHSPLIPLAYKGHFCCG